MRHQSAVKHWALWLAAFFVTCSMGCRTEMHACDATQELDFAAIKEMAGTWVSETHGDSLQIDTSGRPFAYGEDYRFGCEPRQFPLVVDDPVRWSSEVGDHSVELLAARIATGYLRLRYESSYGFSDLIAIRVDEEHLQVIVGNAPPEVFTRICDDLCDPKTGLPLDDESSE